MNYNSISYNLKIKMDINIVLIRLEQINQEKLLRL